MTKNQIDYWSLQESKRHNVSTEKETVRHNYVTEGETKRHNVVNENVDYLTLAENKRHNINGEQETVRHNIASESNDRYKTLISYVNSLNSIRSNEKINAAKVSADLSKHIASLKEQIRHNLATEKDAKTQTKIKALNGQLDAYKAKYDAELKAAQKAKTVAEAATVIPDSVIGTLKGIGSVITDILDIIL